jgi:hypothetical protein
MKTKMKIKTKKRVIIIALLLAIFAGVLLVIYNKKVSTIDDYKYKSEQLLSFFERKTIRIIKEPATLSELIAQKDFVIDDFSIYFVNSSCSFCIGELLSNLALLETTTLNEKLFIATNDTIALSYYLSESLMHLDNRIIVTSKEDSDSIAKLNGLIYKIRNKKTIDMIDLHNLFY